MRYLLIVCALAALSACTEPKGGEAFTYTPPDEIPPGPGLFSGKDGAFKTTIYYD